VQRLKNRELQAEGRAKQVWREKPSQSNGKAVADAQMVFVLPAEFRAKKYDTDSDSDDSGSEEGVAKLVLAQQATFDKPAKNRHLKALYLKGYVDGMPMTKMLVDGGATVNLMPYTTFRKLGKGPDDLIETDLMLKDFGGNSSNTRGATNVEVTVGKMTLLTTFFMIDSKGAYSLLLGRDWIHANCCVPSTMHQCLIQWHGDEVEVIPADDSVSVATADATYWEAGDHDCFSGKAWEGGSIKVSDESQQPIRAIGSESFIKWRTQSTVQRVSWGKDSRRPTSSKK